MWRCLSKLKERAPSNMSLHLELDSSRPMPVTLNEPLLETVLTSRAVLTRLQQRKLATLVGSVGQAENPHRDGDFPAVAKQNEDADRSTRGEHAASRPRAAQPRDENRQWNQPAESRCSTFFVCQERTANDSRQNDEQRDVIRVGEDPRSPFPASAGFAGCSRSSWRRSSRRCAE